MSELESRIRTLTQSATRHVVERVEAIPSGLGAHQFFRVYCVGGATLIARVLGHGATGSGPEPSLEPIRVFLEDAGLPVPRSYLHCEDLDLLEDLGSSSLREIAATGSAGEVRGLYAAACALVPRLQALLAPASPPAAFSRCWSDFVGLKRDRALSVGLPAWLGRAPGPGEEDCVRRAFDLIHETLRDAPLRLAHRDFQSSNLIVMAGQQRLTMIDLQGAFLAPPEYDLMCLLRDSYVVLPDDWVEELCDTTRRALPDHPDPQTFQRRFDLLCIARKAKDDAFFLEAQRRGDGRFAAYRDANRRYLADASRRLAQSFSVFEAWAEWFTSAPDTTGAQACAR